MPNKPRDSGNGRRQQKNENPMKIRMPTDKGDRGKGGFQMGKNCEERNLHRGPKLGSSFQFT
jgi:hypothetical protein